MNLDLYIDTDLRKLVAGVDDPGAPKLPPLTQGDEYRLRLHFLQPYGGVGVRGLRVFRPSFETIKVGLGFIDRAPEAGSWKLKVGANTTPELPANPTKAAVSAALNALASVIALGGVEVQDAGAPNIYRLRWLDADVDTDLAVVEVVENRLQPKCFWRKASYATDAGWITLLKVMQSPIAFTDQFAFAMPPAVTVAEARAGTGARNAVAVLTIPDAAVGSFDLTWSGLTTLILPTRNLAARSLEEALQALLPDPPRGFVVTSPRRGVYYIEFTGPLGLSAQPLPTVTMHDQSDTPFPEAAFSLDVPGAELLLDGKAEAKGLTLECEVTAGGRTITLFQETVTLHNDMIDDPMALVADPEWLEEIQRPTATVDYDPASQVVGMLGYQDFAGDGIAGVWTYTHNLGTLNVHITVRDNVAGTRIPDNTYTAEILNQNQVRITFPSAPDEDQYVVIISAANADNHFLAHVHSIAEISGLQAALDALSAAGNPLELWPVIPLAKLPMIPPTKISGPLLDAHIPANVPRVDGDGYLGVAVLPPEVPRLAQDGTMIFRSRETNEWTTLLRPDGTVPAERLGDLAQLPGFAEAVRAAISGAGISGAALSFALPSASELYPGRAPAPDVAQIDAASLPRPGGLLPAIHDATVTALTVPLPAAGPTYAGHVYENETSDPVQLPGGLGRRGAVVGEGEFAACDGRVWYRVRREGTTSTYHPMDFERELCLLDVNESMMPVGSIFTLLLDFELQILRSETRAQWVLLIELGAFGRVADPAGTYIEGIVWQSSPALTLPLRLTSVRTPHAVGLQVTRTADAITGSTRLYRGAWTDAAAAAPTGPGFVVRARLWRFDTEDHLSDPRGYVFLRLNPDNKSMATIV